MRSLAAAATRLSGLRIGLAMRIASALLFLLLIQIAGGTTFALFRVGIGGPIDQRLTDAGSLHGEMEGPVLYLTEPFAEARDLVDLNNPTSIQAGLDRLRALRARYDAELASWLAKDLPEDLTEAVRLTSEGSARQFWQEIETRLIPLVEQRLTPDAADNEQVRSRLIETSSQHIFDLFLMHRAEVQAVSDATEAYLAEVEGQARVEVRTFEALAIGTAGLGGLLLLLLARGCAVIVTRPLQAITGTTVRLARGELGTPIPMVERKNEIGDLARALETLRDAALRARSLEAEAAEGSREAAEAAERSLREQEDAARAFRETLSRFVEGDLTARLEAEVSGGYEAIKTDLNAGLEQVRRTLAGMKSGIGAIRSGAGEIAQAADDLSRRTEAQAASLEETAAAVEEITSTLRTSAETSAQAREIVTSARTDAQTSEAVVERAVAAMSAIEASSEKIGRITGVIDEIAFQTNLLALNAGVEAARAGDAGRGFAVVATEVRALAQRSAEAARQIKELIRSSNEEVSHGAQLVTEAGDALRRILGSVTRINDLVSTIAAGAAEQASGLGQVSAAVSQLDQITQANAAMVEQATAALRHLAGQSEKVDGAVSRFRVGDGPVGEEMDLRGRDAAAPRAPAEVARAKVRVAVGGGSSRPAVGGWEEF